MFVLPDWQSPEQLSKKKFSKIIISRRDAEIAEERTFASLRYKKIINRCCSLMITAAKESSHAFKQFAFDSAQQMINFGDSQKVARGNKEN